jgi:cell division protein FtsL
LLSFHDSNKPNAKSNEKSILKSKLTVCMKLAFRQKFEKIIGLILFAANILLSVLILITGHYTLHITRASY